jgi:hypothetical protein
MSPTTSKFIKIYSWQLPWSYAGLVHCFSCKGYSKDNRDIVPRACGCTVREVVNLQAFADTCIAFGSTTSGIVSG